MAPEILYAKKKQGLGYDQRVDWWALGTLMYELLIGIPPFFHQNSHKMQKMIKKKDFQYPDLKAMGLEVSDTAKDLINQLLKKDADERLGSNGDVEDILSHPWFQDLDRQKLTQKQIPAPFLPEVKTDEEYIKASIKKDPKERIHSLVPADKKEVIRTSKVIFAGFESEKPDK